MDACMAAASSLEGVPRGLGFQSLEQGSGVNAMLAPTIMLLPCSNFCQGHKQSGVCLSQKRPAVSQQMVFTGASEAFSTDKSLGPVESRELWFFCALLNCPLDSGASLQASLLGGLNGNGSHRLI